LVRVLAQPAHGFTNPSAEGRAAAELRHEAFDLRVVEHRGMSLVAFERAGQLRRDLADEIRRHLHNLWGVHPQRGSYLSVDLVPGEHLVASDVKGLADSLGLAQ